MIKLYDAVLVKPTDIPEKLTFFSGDTTDSVLKKAAKLIDAKKVQTINYEVPNTFKKLGLKVESYSPVVIICDASPEHGPFYWQNRCTFFKEDMQKKDPVRSGVIVNTFLVLKEKSSSKCCFDSLNTVEQYNVMAEFLVKEHEERDLNDNLYMVPDVGNLIEYLLSTNTPLNTLAQDYLGRMIERRHSDLKSGLDYCTRLNLDNKKTAQKIKELKELLDEN